MYRIAISGHRGLPAPTVSLVDQALRAALAERAPDVTGPADGPTGRPDLRPRPHRPRRHPRGRHPRRRVPGRSCRRTPTPGTTTCSPAPPPSHRLPFTESTPESHMAASRLMVDQADELHAVWDGQPARSYGGTADVVAYAAGEASPCG